MNIKMNSKITLLTFLLFFIAFSCKNESPFTDYKYGNNPKVITCEGINTKLYQEALYSFEDDILNYYKKNNPNASLVNAYSQFMRGSIYQRLKLEEVVSKHSVKVFEALKKEDNLWDLNSTKSPLNYNGTAISCISSNILDTALSTTFNALVSTNSMSPKLFAPPLMSKYTKTSNDKYLATYIALDLYYAKMFDIDFSKVNLEKPEQKVDFNQVPPKEEVDPHAGHNH